MGFEDKSVCDENTFKQIFDDHSEVIRNFIYYKCRDMQQAEDITQDAFVKLWKNCKKVVFGKAKSFVMKVAQNAFFNEVAHEKVVLKYNASASIKKAFTESPEFLLEEKEFMEKLQRSISSLPEKERTVFLLSRKDKKTYREIAEIVGITQKAVERRMHLALQKLREDIGRSI
ncbi:RNA polymerase sigma factor [Flagellimonas pacifica]|uniref:RNA polymerase sigma-70 factor, ECF subfamily n=1 Tax=Flagellimonas pacifica TaxID=1247520 RepID=A0A285MHK4_9FLAO|nr:sigma-70 family RNA polymerase sigma factor [Allomuricauda parva]SNY95436.1 RNA polymerase sigma-70 factor, ECF subfamily [Allomuricauda parva]